MIERKENATPAWEERAAEAEDWAEYWRLEWEQSQRRLQAMVAESVRISKERDAALADLAALYRHLDPYGLREENDG